MESLKKQYLQRLNLDYVTPSGKINFVKLIFEWSGGDYNKLNKEKALISIEKYLKEKTGNFLSPRKRQNLRKSFSRIRKKFNEKEFRELYYTYLNFLQR